MRLLKAINWPYAAGLLFCFAASVLMGGPAKTVSPDSATMQAISNNAAWEAAQRKRTKKKACICGDSCKCKPGDCPGGCPVFEGNPKTDMPVYKSVPGSIPWVLAVPPATSDSPVAAVADPDVIPAHHKLLYRIARDHAVAKYARDNKVSRAAAREKVDQVDDTTLHAAVQAAGLPVKAIPAGGKLSDFLDWIATHGDTILAIVKILMSLLAFLP